MIDRDNPTLFIEGKKYAWELRRDPLRVSDVIFWCGSYDLTRPLQLSSVDVEDVDAVILESEGVKSLIVESSMEEKLLYHCLALAFICFEPDWRKKCLEIRNIAGVGSAVIGAALAAKIFGGI